MAVGGVTGGTSIRSRAQERALGESNIQEEMGRLITRQLSPCGREGTQGRAGQQDAALRAAWFGKCRKATVAAGKVSWGCAHLARCSVEELLLCPMGRPAFRMTGGHTGGNRRVTLAPLCPVLSLSDAPGLSTGPRPSCSSPRLGCRHPKPRRRHLSACHRLCLASALLLFAPFPVLSTQQLKGPFKTEASEASSLQELPNELTPHFPQDKSTSPGDGL